MNQYKPLILFLLRFLGSYIGLILIYNWYLNQYLPLGLPDPYTEFNANLASKGFNLLGIPTQSLHYEKENFMRLWVDGDWGSIVNEGCNAISILIIFIAFILAFYTNFKQTISYIIVSLILLFILNIFRIILLTYIYRFHSEYSKVSHDYLFPAVIYGSIVILWIIWIKYFVSKKKADA